MNKKIAASVVGLVILSVAAVAVYLMPSKLERNAEEALRSALVDPDSMQMKVITTTDSHLCGLVNGKNRMGGYSGMSPFIFSNLVGVEVYEAKADYSAVRHLKTLFSLSEHSWKSALNELVESCNFIDSWKRSCGGTRAPVGSEATEVCAQYENSNGFWGYVTNFSK